MLTKNEGRKAWLNLFHTMLNIAKKSKTVVKNGEFLNV